MNLRVVCALALALCPLAKADPTFMTQGRPVEQTLAGVSVPTDGTWIVLDELMTVGSFYSPLFTYSSATPLQLDVTDLFVVSDQNEVYLDGVLLGATPPMPDWPALFPVVGPLDDAPFTTDPNVAWLRPQFSKNSLIVPAGTHMLTLRNIHIPPTVDNVPFNDGTVAFRLVPEPSTGFLALLAATIFVARRRTLAPARPIRRVVPGGSTALGLAGALALLAASAGSPRVEATPCGPLDAAVVSGALEITGTSGADSIRLRKNGTSIVEVFSPVGAGTPSCSYDSTATPFTTIRVFGLGDDDTIVFDDSGGVLSATWIIEIDGGDGTDVVLAGIDLNAIPLASAMSMIATLQQASLLVDRALDLLDTPGSGCGSASTLVSNAATVVKDAGEDLVMPTASYVRDIESDLVQPSAQVVRDARDRIAGYLQTFVATDVLAVSQSAQTFAADVEVHVDDFELLIPMGQALLTRAETLYVHASNMGMATQSGDAISVFQQTIENHIQTILTLSDLCDEDPEPTETQFDENLQDPSGLPPICAELERRIEALEAIIDLVEAGIDGVEMEGDQFEMDGDALELAGENLGDDELNTSAAYDIEQDGAAIEASGDNIRATAAAINADWEQWVGQKEFSLETAGNTMDSRGQTEVLGAANTLHAQAQANVENCAAALRAEADQIVADLQALLVVAAPLLRDDLSFGTDPTCPVTTVNTLLGGPGPDILIGSSGSDLIDGGDGTDLIVGAGGADRLRGGDGHDLIFGGGGNDEIFGGPKVDVLVGNKGDDCIFGGGGQTLTRGSLSVQLGDLFFGMDGNDFIVSGDSTSDALTEIDVAFGNDGDDTIRLSHGGTLTIGSFSLQFGNLTFGGAGADDILTADGIDVTFGGDDGDTIASGKGAPLTIGSGSSQFRLALGDLIFGGSGGDTIDSDDEDSDLVDQDIDVVFGQDGDDTIYAYAGELLSVGDVSNPDFELRLGNLIFGGDNEDKIFTAEGIDVIFGGNHDDVVFAGKGDLLTIGSGSNEFRLALGDLIFGGDGADTLNGDDPLAARADDDIDVIFGGDGDDTISGYNGGLLSIGDASDPDFEFLLGNVIFGGEGADEIETLDGVDLIFCGPGDDAAAAGKGYVLNIDDDFKIDLGDLIFGQGGDDKLHGDAPDPPDEDDYYDGIDVIFGGPGADEVYGGTGGFIEVPDQDFCLLFGNLLFGGPDNDLLRGDYENWDSNDPRGGIDLIFGAGGNDTIEGAGGSLIVVGDITAGQAIIIGFGNLLFGGPGGDTIKGADSVQLCTGVNEDLDELIEDLGLDDLGGAADLIFCGPGNDFADGFAGIDFMFGGEDDDTMNGDNGGFIIVPISGVPTPIALGNLMFGADHDDTITSLGRIGLPTVPPIEIDLLFGGPCYDNISAGDGLNLCFGGHADDIITSGDGINIIFGGPDNDDITAGGIGLNVAFGGKGDDDVGAGDGVNVLFGGRGRDTVEANLGLNLCFGGKDQDQIDGGDGIGLLFGNSANDTVAGGNGLCLAFGNRGDDDVSGANGLIVLFGNAGNDFVTSGAGLSVNFGNADHDVVTGGVGLTVLFGNTGEDRIRSGSGLGVAFGNRQNDILEFGGGGLYVAFGNNDDDVVIGGGGLNLLFGNRGGDHLFGGGGVNIEFGGQLADYMRGGGSADLLFGGAGDDQITGGGARDLIFGNRDNDSMSTDGNGELAFGNRGNDTVRSGGDGSDVDRLFGNRGNDSLFGCNNADKLYGGRGSDSKNRNDCNGISPPSPSRGEVRGVVLIDVDNDNIGDIPHVGVTVTAGSSSAVTDADGRYRIANLAIGGYSVAQNVPVGFTQVSSPAAHAITINGPHGIDLYLNRNFVNRDESCHINANATGCQGSMLCTSQPSQIECRPTVVRRVLRCPDTGAICENASDCPCSDCVPGWAVVECSCVNPFTDCHIMFDAANEPMCSSQCVQGGQVRPCLPIAEGDLFRCECDNPPCPTELARFTFSGIVTSAPISGMPPPWDTVAVGQPWTASYRFVRTTPDANGAVNFGDYRAIVYYDVQIGAAASSGSLLPANTLIRNRSEPGNADVYTAQWNIPVAGPPLRMTVLLDDGLGTAWTLAGLSPRDGLPLCEHIVLSRFDARLMTIDRNPPNSFGPIIGSVDSFDCTNCAPAPAPSPKPEIAKPVVSQPVNARPDGRRP